MKKLSRRDRQTYKFAIISFTFICVLIGILCFQYYVQLQRTLKEENCGYMREISTQMSTTVNKTIKDNFSVLGTVSTVLQNSNVMSYEKLEAVISEQKEYWNYQNLFMIDETGVTYDDKGTQVALSKDKYLNEAIVLKKPSMSSSQVIDGEECIVFAIPIKPLIIEGKKMLAIAASYNLDTFDKILSMTAFDGNGYAHIIRKDGTVVIRSSSKNARSTGYNILNSMETAKINDEKTINDIRLDIANEKSGEVDFWSGDVRKYMTYSPLAEHDWCLLTFVPQSVVNEKSGLFLKITLLLCGFITIAFALLTGTLMLSFYRNKKRLENIAYVDPITGGNTIQRFYELASDILKSSGRPQYAIVYTNIEKFKVLNEQFGKSACDKILCSIKNGIGLELCDDECMGRLFADNFCVLIKYKDEADIAKRLDRWHKRCVSYAEGSGDTWLPFIMEFGIYIITDDSMSMAYMVDRAKLALGEMGVELRGKIRYAIYDEGVQQLLLREKHLEDMMMDALANGEFKVYLQPKYFAKNEKIGGAEALVRWQSPSDGMIYPDEFIYLFEKNGFIIQLDLWVFEEVCKTLHRWISEKRKPVKISVNCSRMHLKIPDFLKKYCQIAEKYQIPKSLLEIELTENAVFEDVEHLTHTIDEIHSVGFGCSMDDFGSGYSSLNLIQDIPVDTLKLDKIFFRKGIRDEQRTESVVGSIISMAKALTIQTVAEGVEHRHQVDMLKRLDCDFIQGYFFAKPMPIAEFEQIVFEGADNKTEEELL